MTHSLTLELVWVSLMLGPFRFSTVAVTSSAYEIAWDVQQAARLVQERTRQRLDAKAKRIAHFRSSVVARVEAVEKAKRAQEAKRQLQLVRFVDCKL